ncbi:hypothetical protein UCDDA912_g04947 [Diaporthe ampelina]|uniref:Uncharacterized protein n=1 Tax=Diaporthe ampelina TaxID=1214573 RepID=A0A0G2FM43_9PEZI|nr:hypothetical protein UCDDA912_g04947 [Diaporthe ampelina]
MTRPIPTSYLLDGTVDGDDDSDDEFPIRPSAALLPHKEHGSVASPPRRRLPDLLQDVLEIMNSITSQQSHLEEESLALQDMVELVVTMQEQADSLMEYSDLVEEYVDVVNDEVGLAAAAAAAASPSSSVYSIDAADVQEGDDGPALDPGPRELASRADSGVSVGDDNATDYEDAHVMEGRSKAHADIISKTPGRAKQAIKEPPFRDSGMVREATDEPGSDSWTCKG